MTSSLSTQEDHWISSDANFDQLYPVPIQQLSDKHWTPLNITKLSCEFLAAKPGVNVLDIGSGVGKFCLATSRFKPAALFNGVEQRQSLVKEAEQARKTLGLSNVRFLHGNFTQVNFKAYDHFYFNNAFFENVDRSAKIDDSIQYSPALYNYYNAYLYKELESMRSNTKIVTYCSEGDEIPPNYTLVYAKANGLLKFYMNS